MKERRDTVFNPDNWRDCSPEESVVCTLKAPSGFGEFTPLRTNGVVALVRRNWDGLEGTVHVSNIIWPKPELIKLTKVHIPKVKKPSRLERLAAEVAEFLATS